MPPKKFEMLPMQGSLADYGSFFRRLDLVPTAHSTFFQDLKLWMTPSRRKMLARNTEASQKRLVKEFLDGAARELYGDPKKVVEEAHRLWMADKYAVIERYTPVGQDLFTRMFELAKNAHAAHTLKSNKSGNSKKSFKKASKTDHKKKQSQRPNQGPEEVNISSGVMLEKFEVLQATLASRLAEMEDRINDFFTSNAPQTYTSTSVSTFFEEQQTPSLLDDSSDIDESQEPASTASVNSTASPEPMESTAAEPTRTGGFPKGIALADRMMRYFHFAKKHDPEAWLSYSTRLKAALEEEVEGRQKDL